MFVRVDGRFSARLQSEVGEVSAIGWLIRRAAKVNRHCVTFGAARCNQSWNGLVKRFSSQRCDYLFVHVGAGRRWFIRAAAVEGGSALLLGDPKYETYEVEPDHPLNVLAQRPLGTLADARRDSGAVKRDGL